MSGSSDYYRDIQALAERILDAHKPGGLSADDLLELCEFGSDKFIAIKNRILNQKALISATAGEESIGHGPLASGPKTASFGDAIWSKMVTEFNQRDRAASRDEFVLWLLESSAAPVRIGVIHSELMKVGLSTIDGRGALATALSRLKALKCIKQATLKDNIVQGFYQITIEGKDYRQELSKNYSDIIVPDHVRGKTKAA